MVTFENLLKEQNFSFFKEKVREILGCTPIESIIENDKVYSHQFCVEMQDNIFEKVECIIYFEINSKEEMYLLADVTFVINGVTVAYSDIYFLLKYPEKFTKLQEVIEEILNDWMFKKETRSFLFNRFTDKRNKAKEIERKTNYFANYEKKFLEVINEEVHKLDFLNAIILTVENECMVEEIIKEQTESFKQRLIDKALDEKNELEFKRLINS